MFIIKYNLLHESLEFCVDVSYTPKIKFIYRIVYVRTEKKKIVVKWINKIKKGKEREKVQN